MRIVTRFVADSSAILPRPAYFYPLYEKKSLTHTFFSIENIFYYIFYENNIILIFYYFFIISLFVPNV